ncbi:MAG: FG-GAP repeat protein, partial [Planctomycetota bacterium]
MRFLFSILIILCFTSFGCDPSSQNPFSQAENNLPSPIVTAVPVPSPEPVTPSLSFDRVNPLPLMAGDSMVTITATGSPAGGTMTFNTTSNTTGGTLIFTEELTTFGTIRFTPHSVSGGSAVVSCTYTVLGVPVSADYTIDVSAVTFITLFELSSLTGANGSIFNGIDTEDNSGYAVSAGDINGDGIDDVIICAS